MRANRSLRTAVYLAKTFKALSAILLCIGLAFTGCGSNPKEDPCVDLECCEGKECKKGDCFDGVCMVCCDDREYFGFIAGTIMQFPPDGTPAQVDYAVLAFTDYFTNENPTHFHEGTTDISGAYHTDCFDMSGIGLCMLILADDAGFDGADGIWYPTYSAVMDFDRGYGRTCKPNAPPAFAVPVSLVNQLAQAFPTEDFFNRGFSIVVVTDVDLSPVSGAVLWNSCTGCVLGCTCVEEPLSDAIYPNADFTAFDGNETSTTGIVLLPQSAIIRSVIGVKSGLTWDEKYVGQKTGHCFTRLLIANE